MAGQLSGLVFTWRFRFRPALISLYVAFVVFVVFNVQGALPYGDPLGAGDPFRDGRIRELIFLGSPVLAVWLSRFFSPWLCTLYAWHLILWAWFGMDDYALQELLLPPLFLLLARVLTRWEPKLVFFIIRLSFGIQAILGACGALKLPTKWFLPEGDFGPIGTIGQRTLLAAFLAPLIPIALFEWSAWEAIFGLGIVLSCHSSMAMAALGGSFAVYVWKKYSLRSGIGVVLVGISSLVWGYLHRTTDTFFNTEGRMPVWHVAWNFAQRRPWTGWGPGSWLGLLPYWDVLSVDKGQRWGQLHSDWGQLFFQTGWPGLVLGLLGISYAVFYAKNPRKAALIAGLAVNMGGNFTIRVPVTGFLLALALVMPDEE